MRSLGLNFGSTEAGVTVASDTTALPWAPVFRAARGVLHAAMASGGRSGRDDDFLVEHLHRVGPDAPFGLDRGGAGCQLEAPLVPGAVDELAVADHSGPARSVVGDHAPAVHPSGAQGASLVRAVVRDRIENAVDVIDPDAVPADGGDAMLAGRDLVLPADNVLSALRQRVGLGGLRDRHALPPGGMVAVSRRTAGRRAWARSGAR